MDITALREQLQADFKSGNIELPALPELTFRIRQALYDDTANLDQVARLIQLDPTITTKLIQIANSAAYVGADKVTSVKDAITKLGLSATRNLVTTLTLKNAYTRQRNREITKLVKAAWNSSCHIGVITRILAQCSRSIQADEAMLAGVLHNVGILPLMIYLEKYPNIVADQHVLRQLSHAYQGALGGHLLKFWKFEKHFLDIPTFSKDLNYNSGSDKITLVDLVIVARAHGKMNDSNREQVIQRLETMPSYKKMSISRLGKGASIQLLDEAKDEITMLLHSLK